MTSRRVACPERLVPRGWSRAKSRGIEGSDGLFPIKGARPERNRRACIERSRDVEFGTEC